MKHVHTQASRGTRWMAGLAVVAGLLPLAACKDKEATPAPAAATAVSDPL
ncbi:MAG: hypothetical protein HY068_11385, partial [Burkholderiales bacterium]|nr:hypothetical protein [Burkholderiales bacterium]